MRNTSDEDVEALEFMLRVLKEDLRPAMLTGLVGMLCLEDMKDEGSTEEIQEWAKKHWLHLATAAQRLREDLEIFRGQVQEQYAQRVQTKRRIEHMKRNANLARATYPIKELYR